MCYGVCSCAGELAWSLALATSHCARIISYNSCLKDWGKGARNNKVFCCIALDSPLAFCHWSRSSWKEGVDYGEQTVCSVAGNQDPVVFQLPVTLLYSCYSQIIDSVCALQNYAKYLPLFHKQGPWEPWLTSSGGSSHMRKHTWLCRIAWTQRNSLGKVLLFSAVLLRWCLPQHRAKKTSGMKAPDGRALVF